MCLSEKVSRAAKGEAFAVASVRAETWRERRPVAFAVAGRKDEERWETYRATTIRPNRGGREKVEEEERGAP